MDDADQTDTANPFDRADRDRHDFVADGKARTAPALDRIRDLAKRAGGQTEMVLMALHGALSEVVGEVFGHVAGTPSGVGGDEGPRDELGASKANNPIEQAKLTAAMHPDLDLPTEPLGGASQDVSPIVEVTAPQSQPTPQPAVKAPTVPTPLAMPTVGQDVSGALDQTGDLQPPAAGDSVVVTPKPLDTPQVETTEVKPLAATEVAPITPEQAAAERLF